MTISVTPASKLRASFGAGPAAQRARVVLRHFQGLIPLRARRLVGWLAVGASGVVVNTAVLWLFAGPLGLHYLWAACVSTQVSSTWNFLLVDRWVFRGAKRGSAGSRWFGFMFFSNSALVARIPVLGLLVSVLGVNYLVANVATLILTFAVRFAAQERLSLHKGEECPMPSTVG